MEDDEIWLVNVFAFSVDFVQALEHEASQAQQNLLLCNLQRLGMSLTTMATKQSLCKLNSMYIHSIVYVHTADMLHSGLARGIGME